MSSQTRSRLRAELGWAPEEQVCVATVGGSSVGGHLLRRVGEAYDAARAAVPGLRMVVATGPRLEADVLPARPGLEVHTYVPELYLQLAACDLAVVQGGLTTTMERAAARTPFIGRCLEYDALSPVTLAAAMVDELDRSVDYRPVESDGAARAAALVAEQL